MLRRRRRLGLGRFLLAGRGKNCMQNCAFHAGHEFNQACVADVHDKPVDDVVSKLSMRHLAAAEAKARLHFVAFAQEADCLILLRLVVVFVNRNGELDFLDDDDLLLFARGTLALFFLVEITAVILDAADRRNRIGRNLNQIQSTLAGDLQRLKRGQDAELFAVFIDDTDFAGANPVVNTDKRLC